MKKTKMISLLILGVLAIVSFVACGGDEDSFDAENPQVGTWYAEETKSSSSEIIKYVYTIRLTKAGTFASDDKEYVTCLTQERVDYYKKYHDISTKLNETVEVKDNERIDEGYYTWNNETKKANITLEKMSYSGSKTFTMSFTFSPDYNTAIISGVRYQRQ